MLLSKTKSEIGGIALGLNYITAIIDFGALFTQHTKFISALNFITC